MARVIIVTGPSGAGKTSTCRKLLESLGGEWAYINQDEVRQQIISGYESAGDYEQNWNEGTKRQWAVSIPICADMVKRYFEYGINCVLDIFAPPAEFEKWKPLLEIVDYKLIVLRPDVETTVKRNAEREERSRLKENKIRQNHALFEPWQPSEAEILDTSDQSLASVVEHIKNL